jgi:hypothetical protein
MNIRRFDNDEGASEMYECDDGGFVTYEEHLKLLDEAVDIAFESGYRRCVADFENSKPNYEPIQEALKKLLQELDIDYPE